MAAKNSLRLRIIGPDGSVHESISEQESVILGSGAGAAIQIPDPTVSNLHVMLKVEQNGVVKAIDLGSEHGTLLREAPVKNPVALAPGDVLVLGRSKVQVLFETPQRSAGAVVTPMPGRSGANPIPSVTAPAPAPLPTPQIIEPRRPTARASNAALKAQVTVPALPFEAPPQGQTSAQPGRQVLQVAMVWGNQILSVQHYGPKVPVTIGEAKKNEFHVFANGVGEQLTLATHQGNKLQLQVPPGAGVVVFGGRIPKSAETLRAAGRLQASAAGAEVLELDLDERAKVTIGEVSFLVRLVPPSPAVPVKGLRDTDFTFFKIAVICLMAAAAVLVAFYITPKQDRRSSDEIFQDNAQYVKLLLRPAQPKIEKPSPEKSGTEEGAKAEGEEGKFGVEEAKKEEADPSRPGSPVVDPNKKEKDRRKVMRSGLLGALGSGGAKGGMSDILGPGGLGSGINNALGGLKGGAGLGDAHGVGGLGSRGTGPGAGGTGLGLGGLGTKGTGRGAGGHGIDLGGRGKDTTRIIPGQTHIVGGLSKEEIARVIRAHQSEIKYCYEAELQKTPDLSGKVAVMFIIGGDGTVNEANVSETSLNNSSAEQCMLTRIKRWKFPEPQGGGIVTVTFPWIFKPAGAEGE